MKKNLVLLILVVILAALAYFFIGIKGDASSSIDVSDRAFTVENIDDVHKIFVARRGVEEVTLTRNGESWLVNGKYKAKAGAMRGVLSVLKNARIQFIPSRNATENIVRGIGTVGIKVEAYDKNNKKLTSYYIGGNTPDERGSYFLMENAAQPYVMELPNEVSVLREKFHRTFEEWRDYGVFEEDESKFKSVSVEYPKQKKHSFTITAAGKYEVLPFHASAPKINKEVNQKLVQNYLKDYRFVHAEYIENKHPRRDSINTLVPFCNISIEYQDGGKKSIRLWPVYEVMHLTADPVELESLKKVERFFGEASWGDFYLIQQHLLEELLMPYSYFFES